MLMRGGRKGRFDCISRAVLSFVMSYSEGVGLKNSTFI